MRPTLPLALIAALTLAVAGCAQGGGPGAEPSRASAEAPDDRTYDALMTAGRAALQNGDTARAAALFGRAAENGAGAEALLARAGALRELGRPDRAYADLEEGIDSPRSVEVLIEMGKAALEAGFPETAIDHLESATRESDLAWDARVALGAARMRQGDLEAARREFRKAVAAAPDKPEAAIGVAMAEARAGELDVAVETLRPHARKPNASTQVVRNYALLIGLRDGPEAFRRAAEGTLPPERVDDLASWLAERDDAADLTD